MLYRRRSCCRSGELTKQLHRAVRCYSLYIPKIIQIHSSAGFGFSLRGGLLIALVVHGGQKSLDLHVVDDALPTEYSCLHDLN